MNSTSIKVTKNNCELASYGEECVYRNIKETDNLKKLLEKYNSIQQYNLYHA